MEYTNSQYESDIQNLKIYKVNLRREIDQLRSQAMGHTKDYRRLCQEKEIEKQRYDAKFSTLMDDYRVRITLNCGEILNSLYF